MNFMENETEQKLRGGYYTPLDLAVYINRWVLQSKPRTMLEPSCGDGVFFQALAEIGVSSPVAMTGFELLPAEAAKAKARSAGISNVKPTVNTKNFLDWAIPELQRKKSSFDAVVGNPPFIRYQYLDVESQQKAETIFELLDLPFTKHTNAWVPFVLASLALLKPGGRLGMILPAEIVHVMHAQSLRTYLGRTCSRLLIIDPEEIWFEDTLQGAVILFAEKKESVDQHGEGLGMVKVKGRDFLRADPAILFDQTRRINGKTVQGKWTRALLTPKELALLDEVVTMPAVFKFDDVAQVNVGIVTGANKFFLVTDDVVEKFNLQKFAHPMFGRSEHCQGVIYDEAQHQANAAKGNPTNFIWIDGAHAELSKKVLEYIQLGESESLHTRYKCRIRKPWYTVPSVHATEIGMLKRSHDTPRLIHNQLEAYTTDTAYRITSDKYGPEKLVYCFLNSLTALSAELEGRFYGGGVLELVPSEIEKLLIPLPPKLRPNLKSLDKKVRQSNVESVLNVQNRAVLSAINLSENDQDQLAAAWLRLRSRRQRLSDPELS